MKLLLSLTRRDVSDGLEQTAMASEQSFAATRPNGRFEKAAPRRLKSVSRAATGSSLRVRHERRQFGKADLSVGTTRHETNPDAQS